MPPCARGEEPLSMTEELMARIAAVEQAEQMQ
jgi:hypothetical protein